jgi:thioredoxin reductase
VVIDSGEQSNRASPVIGGLLGYDQRPPAELYAAGRRELSSYASVEYRFGQVRRGSCGDGGFELEVDDGRPIHARRVLLTTGMQYCPPDIPGLAELWGTSVFQCPFCHGWEMRDKRLAALAAGAEAVHAALMLRGWSDDVVVLTDGRSDLSPADLNALRSVDVAMDDRRIVELIGHDGELTEIAFADGTRMQRDGLLVEAPLRQRTPLAEQLGATCTPSPLAAEAIGVDEIHRTDVGGVFAAGDACTQQPHLAGAVAAGSQAAMIIVQNLLADEFGLPYPPT